MSTLGLAAPCESGSISITTQATTRAEGGHLYGMLMIMNQGDAAALQVRIEVDLLEEKFGFPAQAKLGPAESRSFEFRKPLESSWRGTYPMTVLVHFQDENGHPFTALTCTTVSLKEKGDPGISSTAAPLSMKDDGLLRYEIRNMHPHPRQVRLTLLLPREFTSTRPKMEIELMPGAEKRISFPIRNLSALCGATYPVFLTHEYDDTGIHFSYVSGGLIRIVREGNWFRKTRWYWAAGMVFLMCLFVVLVVKTGDTAGTPD